jgi:hypothetical protein
MYEYTTWKADVIKVNEFYLKCVSVSRIFLKIQKKNVPVSFATTDL